MSLLRRALLLLAVAALLGPALVVVTAIGVAAPALAQTEPALEALTTSLPARRFAPCAAFDAKGRDWYVFGGRSEAAATHLGDTWSLRLGRQPGEQLPHWEQIVAAATPSAPGPRAVRSCSAAFDPIDRRFIVFGGWDGITPTNEVWALPVDSPAPAWRLLCQATSCGAPPSARRAAQLSFDPAGRRLVLFGGVDPYYRNDTWALELVPTPHWVPLAPTGAPPPPRGGHAQVLDETRGLLWIAAGTAPGIDYNDLWALDVAANAWSPVLPNGCPAPCPTARSGATLVHDRLNDQLVLYGGWESAPNVHPVAPVALQGLDGAPAWSPIEVASEQPQPRFFHVAAYDEAEARMLIFGGGVGTSAYRDAAALELDPGLPPAWRGVAPATGLTARDQAAVHLDDGWLFAFGGFGSGTFPGRVDAGSHLADGWRVRLGGAGPDDRWRPETPLDGGSVPLPREAAAVASDTTGRRMFVVGGLNGDRELADVWMATFDGRGRPAWQQVCSPTSCGAGPAARWGAHAVFDPVAGRIIVFGGRRTDGSVFDDTWALELTPNARWSRLDAGGPLPPGRWGGAVVYDPLHHRMVVTAGQQGRDTEAVVLGDTWALSLAQQPAWIQLVPEGEAPQPRRSPAFAARSTPAGSVELVMTTGLDATTATHFNDVWRLHLDTPNGRWELLAPSDCLSTLAPACRRSASAVFDPRHDQLVVVFGRDNATFFADAAVFELDMLAWRPPNQPPPPSP